MNDVKLDSIIDSIYDAASNQMPWQKVMDNIIVYSDARSCFMQYFHQKDEDITRFVLSGLGDDVLRDYREHFSKNDNTISILEKFNAFGKIVTSSEVFPSKIDYLDLYGKEYYFDLLKKNKLDHLAGTLFEEIDGRYSSFTVQRDQLSGPFTEKIIFDLQSLIPHLRRALRIYRHLETTNIQNQLWLEAIDRLNVGVVLFDNKSKPVYLNTKAEEILKKDNALAVTPDGLYTKNQDQNKVISGEINDAINKSVKNNQGLDCQNVIFDNNGAVAISYVVSQVTPVQNELSIFSENISAIMIFKSVRFDVKDSVRKLKYKYGLSRTEEELVSSLVNGETLENISARRKRSIATIRNQVKSIFLKTGTHSQKDILSLLHQLRTRIL